MMMMMIIMNNCYMDTHISSIVCKNDWFFDKLIRTDKLTDVWYICITVGMEHQKPSNYLQKTVVVDE